MVRNLDDTNICVITLISAEWEWVVEGGSLSKIALVIKFGFLGATMDGIGLRFRNILDKMGVEMVKVDLGILNLLDWLVGGEGGERGNFGGHLGHEIIHLGLALPLIDLLNLRLVLVI